jgi:peptidoglycan hydrolase CwlO-like protein
MSNETVTYSLEAVLTRIEGKIDSLQRDVNKLEIGQSELKGEIKALDERLTTEIKGLTARVANQEFIPFFKKYVILGKGIVCVVKRQ